MFLRHVMFAIGIVATTLFSTCNKYPDSENGPCPREPHFDLKNECKNIGESNSIYGFTFQLVGTYYHQPRFNPNDADEIIYHEWGGGFSRLIKYRISTGEKNTFLESVPRTIEIDWGRGGWIAFSDYGSMYLIKEDGTELHQVPIPTNQSGYSCAEPDFNPDGTVVGFPFGGIDNIGLYGMYLLYDVVNKSVDTFRSYKHVLHYARPLAWSINNKMTMGFREVANGSRVGLGYVDMTTKDSTLIFRSSDKKWTGKRLGIGDIQWSETGDRVFSSGSGIFCYPINEYKELRLKKGCESRYYQSFAISPDDQHIVVERVDVKRSKPLSNTLEERHRLFIMDIDGCNERLLIGDE